MTSTLPFSGISGAESAAASTEMSRPTTLCQFANLPSSLSELRARWASLFNLLYAQFLMEQSKWALSEGEARAIVDERVTEHICECEATDVDMFHIWAYNRLFNC
jgi:hypothetical protein